jgi:outer membrane protein OmpA-like peptidoglycan-associated protein
MKHLLFVSMCLAGAVTGVTAQEVQTVETKTTQTTETVETVSPVTNECGHIDVTHFSFGLKTGVNYFTMSPPAPSLYDKFNLSVGGNIDYTINPMYGFGLEYMFSDYTRPYTYTTLEGLLKGYTHDVILYSSVNLSNVLSPFRTGFWRNLNVYGDVGGGVAFYKFDRDFGAHVSTSETAPPAAIVKLGLNAEFTLSEYFNLNFEGQYRQYQAQNMGSTIANRNNEGLMFTIGLRYKFANSELKHARNISLCEYSPKPVPVIVNNTTIVKGDTQATLDRLSASEKEKAELQQKMIRMQEDANNTTAMNALAAQNANAQNVNDKNALATQNANAQSALATQNANLKQKVDNMEENAKNSGIQNDLSTQNTALQQKLINMEADIKRLETQKEGRVIVSIENIEFKTGSNDLTPASTQILDQVSGILINNAYWTKLRVIGHTDNVGSNALNQRLSESRALAVKEYLLFKGIPSKNLLAVGMGEEQPTESNATVEGRQKNRRVEFEVSK